MKEEVQSNTKDKTSMNIVKYFIHGMNDERLENVFKLLGLGTRNKYEITENKDLMTALEVSLFDQNYSKFEIIYKHNCEDGDIMMVNRVIMRNF